MERLRKLLICINPEDRVSVCGVPCAGLGGGREGSVLAPSWLCTRTDRKSPGGGYPHTSLAVAPFAARVSVPTPPYYIPHLIDVFFFR